MRSVSLPPASGADARILLLFLDGVGLAPAGPENPLATVPMPAVADLLGGPLTLERLQSRPGLCLRAIDATLGVPGLPQSGTGQTALFTGVNAARRLGHHVAAFPGPRLRAILARASLFRALSLRGVPFAFANAYAPAYARLVEERRLRWPATVWAVRAGAGRVRDGGDLARGAALTWDVVGDLWSDGSAPLVTPEQAGARLASLAAAHRVTLYESHLTDLAGHARRGVSAAEALARIDGLIAGVRTSAGAEVTVVVVSDHGNVEEAGHRRHTRNPVPLLAFGRHAANFRRIRSILGVAPATLRALGCS